MSRRAAALLLLALAVSAGRVRADGVQVDCGPGSTLPIGDRAFCTGVRPALLSGGYSLAAAEQVDVGDGAGGLVIADTAGLGTITFTYIHDGGDFMSCFGFCNLAAITPSVLAPVQAPGATDEEQLAFAKECIITHGRQVFNDSADDPGATKTLPITTPATIATFIIPDDRIPSFAADPDFFFYNSTRPRPLFSLPGANPECKDQLVVYNNGTGSNTTQFMWEDITRKTGGGSDEDFGDLTYEVDTEIVLEPPISTTTHYCEPGQPGVCTEAFASSSSDDNTATISWGPDGAIRCDDP